MAKKTTGILPVTLPEEKPEEKTFSQNYISDNLVPFYSSCNQHAKRKDKKNKKGVMLSTSAYNRTLIGNNVTMEHFVETIHDLMLRNDRISNFPEFLEYVETAIKNDWDIGFGYMLNGVLMPETEIRTLLSFKKGYRPEENEE